MAHVLLGLGVGPNRLDVFADLSVHVPMDTNPANPNGAEHPAAKNIPMNNEPNPERPSIEADFDADAALDNDYQDMSEEEFERFLAIAVEGYADAVSGSFAEISTYREAGVLISNRGLVVRIGEAEFQITIVRSR